MKDLGQVANVTVINGGIMYSNATDSIYAISGVGYGAEFDFITNNNGTITSVIVLNPGEGYSSPLSEYITLSVANSLNPSVSAAGYGASLIPYGYNEGETFTTSVSDIGRIIDFRIESRGFDYITQPNVSLRIIDVNISTPITPSDALTLTDGTLVYQGDDQNNPTFSAYLEKTTSVLSSTSPSFIRLYNYTGSINTQSQLYIVRSSDTYAVTPNISSSNIFTVYGNGTAKANVQFLNGLINYNGFYLNTDGQLSADQYLQNYTKYHNFSYVIQVEQALQDFKDALLKIAHPAGMQVLSEYIIPNQDTIIDVQSSAIAVAPLYEGSLSVNPFDSTSTVVGTGTSFTKSNVGDLLVINSTNSSREQVKIIKNITNDTHLTLESNTRFLGNGTITITQPTAFSNIQSYHSGTYSIKTNSLTTAYTLLQSTSDYFYVGNSTPFTNVIFSLSTLAQGLTLYAEYWNGSVWTQIPYSTDLTNNLTTPNEYFNFPSPKDWVESSVNNSSLYYWIRFSTTTVPSVTPTSIVTNTPLSNTIIIQTNIYGNIVINDNVSFNIGTTNYVGKVVYDPVTSENTSAIVLNIASSILSTNTSNIIYYVYPTMSGVSYEIVNNL
jgi:hypothetical protein